MDKYIAEVELRSDAMQEPWAIAQALYALADSLVEYANISDIPTRNIRDYNGNIVGYGATKRND